MGMCVPASARARDACRWHPSRIVKVDVKEQKAFVHFNGWNEKYTPTPAQT